MDDKDKIYKVVTPPSGFNDPGTWQQAVKEQGKYSRAGLAAGVVCILLGVVLFLLGVTGNIQWSASVLGFSSKLTDAAPGAVLFVVGVIVIVVTAFNVGAKGKDGGNVTPQQPVPPTTPQTPPQPPAPQQ